MPGRPEESLLYNKLRAATDKALREPDVIEAYLGSEPDAPAFT